MLTQNEAIRTRDEAIACANSMELEQSGMVVEAQEEAQAKVADLKYQKVILDHFC